VCVRACARACVRACARACLCVCVRARARVCVYVCVRARVFVFLCFAVWPCYTKTLVLLKLSVHAVVAWELSCISKAIPTTPIETKNLITITGLHVLCVIVYWSMWLMSVRTCTLTYAFGKIFKASRWVDFWRILVSPHLLKVLQWNVAHNTSKWF
jgi:hypothetical protein